MRAATDVREQMGRIDALIQALERIADPAAQDAARELVQALLDLHGAGLERILERAHEAAGQALIDELGADDLVGGLLLLHGLHPFSIEARVLQALDAVRPYLRSHEGDVELTEVSTEGTVRLRLEGSCHGCPSSRATLEHAIEEAIYEAAPDVTAIEVEGAVEEPPPAVLDGFIPISQVAGATNAPSPNGSEWVTVAGLSALQEGALRVVEVAGRSVLLCRVGGKRYAYGGACPQCLQTLDQAELAGPCLTCTACGHRYDVVRAGRALDDATGHHLEPYPLLDENGQTKVKVF